MEESERSVEEQLDYWAGQEQAKYEKVWTFDRYRKHSPGEQLVSVAIDWCGMQPGESVNDYGCGSGRAARSLAAAGYTVLGIDIAVNCLDAGLDIPFLQASLWDLRELDQVPIATWGFCTDVMEHIPERAVPSVIKNIRDTVSKGCFFQIYLCRDGFGQQIIGEDLHLTVRDPDWWLDQLREYFRVDRYEARGTRMMVSCLV